MISIIPEKAELIFSDGTVVHCIGHTDFGYATTEEVDQENLNDQASVAFRTFDLDGLPIDSAAYVKKVTVFHTGLGYSYLQENENGEAEEIVVEDVEVKVIQIDLKTRWEVDRAKLEAAMAYISMISDDDAILDILDL